MDIYRTLLDERDGDEERIWTYFRQPAVLDYGEGVGDSSTWVTLWPEFWNGKSLARKRRDSGWNLIFQQLDIDDDMTFRAEAVNASVNGQRFPGPMTAEGIGHRKGGMAGLYMVGGFDPAATGNSAIVIAGIDRETLKRYILDGWNHKNATSGEIIKALKYYTEVYNLHEWVIERNALQRFITQLPELEQFIRGRGCKITPHYTTANKFDDDWGVQTMAPLFDSCVIEDKQVPNGWRKATSGQLIELPSTRQNPWVNELIQQLTVWSPSGMTQKTKTDLVMALWFTHLAFSKILQRKQNRNSHMTSPFLTPAARGRQQVIDLAALRREKQERAEAV
jgi:hypothetical protein